MDVFQQSDVTMDAAQAVGPWLPVSVVVVNHNAGRLLGECLEAALDQAAEVILVDNASAPGPLEAVLRRFDGEPRLTVIRSPVNTGFAAGCNMAAAVSTQSSILFLNPDCTLAPDSLAALYRALRADDSVGMVGGLLLDESGAEQGGARRSVPTPWRSFIRGFGLGRLGRHWPRVFADFYLHNEPLPASAVDVEAISGACTMVKREAVEAVGPWDEGFFLHCEDLDWCMRFRTAGWGIRFVPDAPAVHHRGMCGRSRPLFVEWHKHKGMVRFYRKHFRHQYPLGLLGLVIGGVWLRFAAIAARLALAALPRQVAGLAAMRPRLPVADAVIIKRRLARSATVPS